MDLPGLNWDKWKKILFPPKQYAQLTTYRGDTAWGIPWDVHPQPQLRREVYKILNGEWDFAAWDSPEVPPAFPSKITVPYPPEAGLSGPYGHFPEGYYLFYRRSFTIPLLWGKGRILLHIGAVDQQAEVYVNQTFLGSHLGGYESFTFDITHLLQEENTLLIRCTDDLGDKRQPRGKQVPYRKRGGMWYTPTSGIWQSVWLELVPENYVNHLDISVTRESAKITVTPPLSGVVRLESGEEFPLVDGVSQVTPREIRLWSPEDPYLYRFTLTAGKDSIRSYFALRTIEVKPFGGIPRLCLNGKPYFFHGMLDQGYWPDGIFTPAAPECYADDILAMKRLGFNTLRKHIKVEPEQFYYDCDRLGMIVFQDMVNNGKYCFLRDTALPTVGLQKRRDKQLHKDEAAREAFIKGMKATVNRLKNHPCICYWTIFNEGWGQFDSERVYTILKELDSSRIIDTASGWFRGGKTDVDSRHIYFTPWSALKPSDKPLVLTEFGGYACSIKGHIYNLSKSYGYRTCKDKEQLQEDLEKLYYQKVIPAIEKGLCAAIYTQVSDVEDEINGLLTYDRRVCKVEEARMQAIAKAIQEEYNKIG